MNCKIKEAINYASMVEAVLKLNNPHVDIHAAYNGMYKKLFEAVNDGK